MNVPQLRVFTRAVIRGLMPLGVAQMHLSISANGFCGDSWLDAVRRCSTYWGVAQEFEAIVIRGLMPLGVAQENQELIEKLKSFVIRGLMPLGVAQ